MITIPTVTILDCYGRRWHRRTIHPSLEDARAGRFFSTSFRLHEQQHCLDVEDLIEKHSPLTDVSGVPLTWNGTDFVPETRKA